MLNAAAPRAALIYLESPCDLGQQICGIRSVALSLRNANSQLRQPIPDRRVMEPGCGCSAMLLPKDLWYLSVLQLTAVGEVMLG